MAVTVRRSSTCTVMPSPTARTTSFRRTQTVRPTPRNSGRCLSTVMTTTSRLVTARAVRTEPVVCL
jgi:hypothetical protein